MVFLRHEHATFVSADPPRDSWLALWRSDGVPPPEPEATPLEISAETNGSVESTKVLCRRVSIQDALDALIELSAFDHVTPSVQAWATAARVAVDLIGRGLVRPGVTAAGVDAWEVTSAGASDASLRSELAQALPAEAYAIPVGEAHEGHRVMSPERAVAGFTAAVADVLPRTSAAAKVTGAGAFAQMSSTVLDPTTTAWIRALSPRRSHAAVALRIIVPESADGRFEARLGVRSNRDASFAIDADRFWTAPSEYASEVGNDAAEDILLTLRRGAQVWPALDRLLDQREPSGLVLDAGEIRDLLSESATDLAAAGVVVEWPKEQIAELQLIPVVTTVPTGRDEGLSPSSSSGALSLDVLAQLQWRAAVDGEELTDGELAALMDGVGPLIRIGDRWVRVDETRLNQLGEQRSIDLGEALAIALGGASSPGGDLVDARVTGPIAELAERLGALDSREAVEAAGFNGTLRDYQQRGLTWLAEMTALGLGGVLADDMGLGKTIQVLALHLARTDTLGPTLVVCPATLIANWEREAARFAPGIPVRRFHGAERTLDDVAPNEIVIATYGLVRRDADLLSTPSWGLVIADEAQAVKNPQSRTARELRRIPAKARFGLTGTPVENHLTDLWALLDWTTPGLLGPQARFRREVALPIERNRDVAKSESFSRLIAPFVLRRRKSDPEIAPELPPKTETDHFVSLSAEQAGLYRVTTEQVMAEVTAADGITRRGLVLKLITELKQICNHPAHFLRQSGPLRRRSGKLDAVDELLDVIIDEGDRTLIFTQYVEMGSRLEAHLAERGLRVSFLHGSVPVVRRQQMVDAFQAGEFDVFILSLKAGGTGLNLTAATHVIHYDRWWNPAVEDQASDRAWRIGQDRPVQVHRMVCEGTLEERIAEVISSKRDLAESVVGGGESWISELSDDDLTELVMLAGVEERK